MNKLDTNCVTIVIPKTNKQAPLYSLVILIKGMKLMLLFVRKLEAVIEDLTSQTHTIFVRQKWTF